MFYNALNSIRAQITLPFTSFLISVVYLAVKQSLDSVTVVWILTSLLFHVVQKLFEVKLNKAAEDEIKNINAELGKVRSELSRLNLMFGLANSGRESGLRSAGINEPR